MMQLPKTAATGLTRRRLIQYAAAAGIAASLAHVAGPRGLPAGRTLRRALVGGDWVALGPQGGYFPGFAASSSRMFAGSDDSGGIYYSDDEGGTWTRSDTPVDATGWDLTVSVYDEDVVYATDIYGRHPVMRSTDGGATWTDIVGTGLSGFARTVSCLVELSATTILVGTGEVGSPGDGVWQGVLSGGSWTWSRSGPASGSGSIAGVRVHKMVGVGYPSTPAVFAAVWPEPAGDCDTHLDAGLYYLDGTGWHRLPLAGGIADGYILSLEAGFGGELLFGVVGTGTAGPVAYRWNYSGNPTPIGYQSGFDASWSADALAWSVIAGQAQSGRNVYYVSDVRSGVYRIVETTSGSYTWTRCGGLPAAVANGDAAPLTLGLCYDGRVMVGGFNNAGIHRTASATSTTFTAANDGVDATEVTSIAVRPDTNWIIATLLGNYHLFPDGLSNGIVVSKDEGLTWNPPGSTGTGFTRVPVDGLCVSVSPETPSRTLLGTFKQGIWLSTDGDTAMTFARQTGGADPILATETVTAVMFIDDDHAVAAVATHGEQPTPTCEDPSPTTDDVYSLRYSTDGGVSWANSNLDGGDDTASFAGSNFAIGAVIPNSGGIRRIWAAGRNEHASTGDQRGLYYSDDRGATWTAASTTVKKAGCVLPDLGNVARAFAGGGDGGDEDLFFDVTIGGSTSSMHVVPSGSRGSTGDFSSLLYHSGRFLAGFSGAERRVGGTIGSRRGAVYEWDGIAGSWSTVHSGLVNDHIRNQMAIVYTSSTSAWDVVAPTYGGGVIRLEAG